MKRSNLGFPVLLVLVISAAAIGEEVISSPLGLSIEKPKDWQIIQKLELEKSVLQAPISDDFKDKLLKAKDNSVPLIALMKYAPAEKEGFIPTIQVRMRSNPIADFEDFMAAFIRSVNPSKMPFEKYSIVGKPAQVMVSGLRAVKVVSEYSFPTSAGKALLRAKTYAIPHGKHFFQATFIDTAEDDCSALFENAVKTIRIGIEPINK